MLVLESKQPTSKLRAMAEISVKFAELHLGHAACSHIPNNYISSLMCGSLHDSYSVTFPLQIFKLTKTPMRDLTSEYLSSLHKLL